MLARRDFMRATTYSVIGLAVRNSTLAGNLSSLPNSTDQVSGPIPEFYSRVELPPASGSARKRILVQALSYDLVQESIADGQDLSIFADTVKISGLFKHPGTNIFLHARTITAATNSVIDVSGEDSPADKDHNSDDHAAGGPTLGAAGATGADGGAGADAGNVIIVAGSLHGNLTIKANGGKGGSGQGGGSGAQGTTGPSGTDASSDDGGGHYQAPQPGHKGGTGGIPGPGGSGGDGGNAGIVTIDALSWQGASLSFTAQGGMGGSCGDPGNPGPGGLPGVGGRTLHCRTCGRASGQTVACNCTPTGPRISDNEGAGDSPASIAAYDAPSASGSLLPMRPSIAQSTSSKGDSSFKASGVSTHPGRHGSSRKSETADVVRVVDVEEIGKSASLNTTLMMLHEARLDYLSDRSKQCFETLSWIEGITRSSPGSDKSHDPHTRLTLPTIGEWDAVRAQATTLLNQIASGLDFYGFPYDYVPLVSYQTYKQTIAEVIGIAKDVEASYRLYRDQKMSKDDRMQALESSVSLAQQSIDTKQNQITVIEEQISDTQKTVLDMLASLARQQQLLEATEEAFKDAVSRLNGKNACDFARTLQIVASVVSLAKGAYENASDLLSLFEGNQDPKLAKELGKSASDMSLLMTKLEKSSGDVQGLAGAYSNIKDKLSEFGNDSAKIVVRQEEFEVTVQKYADLGLPEAIALKDQTRAYVDTATTRNRKILELDSFRIKKELLTNEINSQRAELARILELKAGIRDPDLAEYVVFLKGINEASKQDLIRLLYQERRAWEFWALETHPFLVFDKDVATLERLHQTLLTGEVDVLNARTTTEQPLTNVVILIKQEGMKTAFTDFKKTGLLDFSIALDHPVLKYGAALTVKGVNVSIPGIKVSGDNNLLVASLTHSGRSSFLTQERKKVVFTHKPRNITIIYPLTGEGQKSDTSNNMAGAAPGEIALSSPASLWRLALNVEDGLDLSGVVEVKLIFELYFLPFKRSA